eukprot:Polyplicarium_translucidae@DN2925_c0_g1_i1.p1
MAGPVSEMSSNDPAFETESEEESFFDAYRPSVKSSQLLERHSSYSHGLAARSPLSEEEFSCSVESIVNEFHNVESTADVESSLRDLGCPRFHDLFVCKATRMAFDHSPRLQQRTAVLISSLAAAHLVTKNHLYRAMEKLIQSVEDLKIDILDAADRLMFFIDCFVEDALMDQDIYFRLPQSFLRHLSDPTIDASRTLKEQITRLSELKTKIEDFEIDFFSSGSADETAKFLAEIGLSVRHCRHEFVKHLVKASFSKTDREREMVSQVMSSLYGVEREDQLHPDDIQLGFSRLLGSLEDAILDAPSASELMSKFLCRAVVDEIVPPSFLQDQHRLHIGGKYGIAAVSKSHRWLSENAQHHMLSEKFRKIWTGTDPDEPETREFKMEIRELIFMVLDFQCYANAVDRINAMDLSPDQGTELVRKIMSHAMDRPQYQAEVAMQFIAELHYAKEIDDENIEDGFKQLAKQIPELLKDDPLVIGKVVAYIDAAKEAGLPILGVEAGLRAEAAKHQKS